jgi:NADPH-dependent 7-cyano-7-deazaguanine reductase QueF-like protein
MPGVGRAQAPRDRLRPSRGGGLAYNRCMVSPHDSSLGRAVDYGDTYDASRLFPIPRAAQRESLGAGASVPFLGVDVWNAYELSWLDPRGKPQVAVGEFRVPCKSPNLIESKSLKLYLTGYAQERIGSIAALGSTSRSTTTARRARSSCAPTPPCWPARPWSRSC